MRQKDCDMDRARLLICLFGAVGAAWRVAAAPGAFLSPENTAAAPYTFTDAAEGATYELPSDAYPEWKVFNAASAEVEAGAVYSVAADDRGTRYLDFSSVQTLAEDLQAYLTLGISAYASGPQEPLSIEPEDPALLRLDNVCATVRFALSDTAPDMETLQEMYPSYEESLPSGDTGLLPTPTAAKLGVCVLQDGYFYVSRVVSGQNGQPGTGRPEDLDFQFCKTNHTYDEVGGGAVTVRIEFCSYMSDEAGAPITRGFRIWVRDANNPDAEELCLTEGLGYRWLSDAENGYRFDFSSLEGGEGCDWFFLIDNAMAAGGNIGVSSLEALSQLGFSATDGGFYAAWLSNTTVPSIANLDNYELGAFADYFAQDAFDNPVIDWASRYGVTLTKWLAPKTSARARMAAGGEGLTDYAYNAFLLDMDPALGVEQRLTVTGIVPERDNVTLTVRGPEGSSLRRATAADRVGRICVSRAETLDALADAPIERIDGLAFDGEGNAVIVLPRGETETPFFKVTLQAAKDVED